MRKRLLFMVCLSALACGGGDPTAPPVEHVKQIGTLVFRIDSQTCTSSRMANFYLDLALIGTQEVSAGSTHTFPNQPAGAHVVEASEVQTGGYVWPRTKVTIPAGGTFTLVLPWRQCPAGS